MPYLVELRSDTGDREDYWPVDSFVLDATELAAEELANEVNARLEGTDHFVTIEPVETVPAPAAALATLPAYLEDRAKEKLRDGGWLDD